MKMKYNNTSKTGLNFFSIALILTIIILISVVLYLIFRTNYVNSIKYFTSTTNTSVTNFTEIGVYTPITLPSSLMRSEPAPNDIIQIHDNSNITLKMKKGERKYINISLTFEKNVGVVAIPPVFDTNTIELAIFINNVQSKIHTVKQHVSNGVIYNAKISGFFTVPSSDLITIGLKIESIVQTSTPLSLIITDYTMEI